MKDFVLFSGSSNQKLTEKIASHLGTVVSDATVIRFSEGNTYVRLDAEVKHKDVFIVQTIGLDPNNEFMELLFFVDAAKRGSARSIQVIMPYFSYAKGDKLDDPLTSIRAKVCADALERTGVTKVVTMDLHAPQIQGFFNVPNDHLTGRDILAKHLANKLEDPVVFSPDAGFVKEARKFAALMDASIAIGDKVRKDHGETVELLDIIGEVKERNIIIVDDFSITAGTLVKAAMQLKAMGAGRIIAAVSHALLDSNAVEKIGSSDIEKFYTLDTVENFALKDSRIEIISAAECFAQWIRNERT